MGEDTFDYVIVGAGAAGSVLANRLTQDDGVTVCVLEAGPRDLNPYIHIPAGFIKTLFDPAVTWQFKTEPTANTAGRPIATTQGRVLGGGSSINGMVYNRGQPADLDNWAQRGNRGWGYADMLPYYMRTERRVMADGSAADPAKRGDGDGVPVTDMGWVHPMSEAFIAGCLAAGIPRNPDYNSGDQAGVGYFQRVIERGWRVSAARAFLRPAQKRRGLEVRTEARATGVVFEGKRAVGVRYARRRGGPERTVRARREVILSAGTVNTARLLQISGVGPAELLGELGVPAVHVMPGVGRNFRDHYAVRLVMRAKPGVPTLNELSRGPRLVVEMAKWAAGKPNILDNAPSQVHLFWRSWAGAELPDLQCVFTPGSYAQGKTYVLDSYPGVTAGAWPHRPESHGHVRAVSRDPWDDPVIQPNYLSDPMDQQVTLGGIKLIRSLLHAPALAGFLERETLPGPGVESDEELLQFARENGSTCYHLIGTAKMGPASDPGAVVSDRLLVHGLEGLRVVDASIMPAMPSANTYATTLMIAERASDFIRGKVA